MPDGPLPLKAVHHVELLVGNAKQACFFYRKAFGFSQLAYAGPETGVREQASYVLYQGDIRLVVSTPLASHDPMAEHLRLHGDGVLDIAFLVDDVDACFQQAVDRGAQVALAPYDRTDDFGRIRRVKLRAYGDTLHSLISVADYRGPFLPGYHIRRKPAAGAGLERIDHIVGNVENGRMNDWGTYYNKVLGFHQFMTFDDKDISTEFSALRSQVMAAPNETIKFPINEPAPGRRKSQIQEYLDYNAGAGVQHIALSTPDIIHTVSVLRDNGVEFLAVPDLVLRLPAVASWTMDRIPILYNCDVALSLAQPTGSDEFFYRNAEGDEIVYVSEGNGVLETHMGELPYGQGDYLVIPRGILHRYRSSAQQTRLLIIESAGPVRPPVRYSNERGQFLEHSPYCERDIRRPEALPVHLEQGIFRLVVKQNNVLTEVLLDHHPLDVVGWDGYYYPWALSIHDFEPIVGSLHQPPPVHQTFQGHNFVVCSFVPRLFDFHPDAVPVPYNHSNVESDEVLYYANSEFMSRKGIEYGSLTLHPAGLPHGPHPGRVEQSLGKQRTDELAVMLDTFHPLHVSRQALEVEDRDYARSWLEA